MKPSVLWHFLAVLDSTRCCSYGTVQSLEFLRSYGPFTSPHSLFHRIASTLFRTRIAPSCTSRSCLSLGRCCLLGLPNGAVGIHFEEKRSCQSGLERGKRTLQDRREKVVPVISFFLSFILSAGLIFLCGSSHHVITGRKKMHTTCYLLTCLRAVTPIFSGICSILSSPAAEKFDRKSG